MRAALAPGVRLLRALPRDSRYRGLTLVLTFLCYTSYHLSRKPISIVKSQLHPNCSALGPNPRNDSNSSTWCSWAPFDGDNYKELFGALDNAFLVAYAIGMFISGIFGERLPLRYYLAGGMVLSGLFTALFGLGYFWDIHVLWYFIIVQVCNGLVQTTGWPAVVACVGNWFGKGKRGLIMGIWNSHTSVGNILGSLIAGAWVSSAWGLSFIVPGIIIAAVGIVCFFFLVEYPEDVGCSPPLHHVSPVDSQQASPGLGGCSVYWEQPGCTDRSDSPKEPVEEPEAISFLGALRIPGVVEFSLCLLFAKLVSYTFLYWLPLYIVNVAHFSAKEAGDLSTLFDVGGILGGIFAGLISDYTGGRATTCCVMLVVAAPMLFLYNHVGQNGIGTSIAMLIVCGALVNGPYALITTAVSADLGTHESLKGNAKALSTVTAIIDGTGSVGAALGPLLAGLISPTGWNNVFYMLIAADVLACLLLARVVVKEVRGWCGCIARKRGYVRTVLGWPPVPQCQNMALVPLRKDVCYPLLSLLHLHAGTTRPSA
ncbi:glucose-6-phosphate exchanger SLC37A2 isoform X4 [Larus michahellis]|uniref:glucose-6-phosphate exchanger SLC37A2 isoform X4 n=1 Tax=Larus michahellis TaxID=119627 RepID=UPI003D9B9C01